VSAAATHAALLAFRLGELCGAADDGLRYRLTVQAGSAWMMFACSLIRGASIVLAGDGDKVVRLVGIEGAGQVLSAGVRCGWMKSENVDQLEALGGCSVADLLDEQAKCILQLQGEGRWVGLSPAQILDVIAGCADQFPGLMRGPFALELDALAASLLISAPVPAAGAGSKGVVASVAALRAAFCCRKAHPGWHGCLHLQACRPAPAVSYCLLQCLLQPRWACPGGGWGGLGGAQRPAILRPRVHGCAPGAVQGGAGVNRGVPRLGCALLAFCSCGWLRVVTSYNI